MAKIPGYDSDVGDEQDLEVAEAAGADNTLAGQNEALQRQLKVGVFFASMFFCLVLLILFVCYTVSISSIAKNANFDWHALYYGSIIILPASAVMILVSRSVFSNTSSVGLKDAIPLLGEAKEIIKDLISSIKS